MPLSSEEKNRVLYHLGYPLVNPAGAITFNVPTSFPAQFLALFGAGNLTGVFAEGKVRDILCVMDGIESRLQGAQDRLAAKVVDEIELNPEEPAKLEEEYVRWGFRLANMLGGYPNPYSERYAMVGDGAWSVRVAGPT
jgi:hypothetical protein